jgi:hypothetical protein
MGTFGDTFGNSLGSQGLNMNLWITKKICVTGDSISHGVDGLDTLGQIISNKTGCRQNTIAWPSEGTVEQKVRWDALSVNEKLSFDYVINWNGNNIINWNTAVSVSVDAYMVLMNAIIAETKPSCKIIVCTLTPAQDTYAALYPGHEVDVLANRQSFNEALKGNGSTPVTGQKLLQMQSTSNLDDGAYSLKSMYWNNSGDHLHVNLLGRNVMADDVIAIINKDLQTSIIGSVSLLTLSVISAHQINLAWTNSINNNLEGFKVERSTDGVNYTVVASRLNTLSSFSDTTVSGNTTYYYRVIGFKGSSYTAYTNVVNGTTPVFNLVDQASWFTLAYWNQSHNANWTQVGSTLSSDGNSGDTSRKLFWTVGHHYRISWTITRVSGTLRIHDLTTAFISITSAGSGSIDITATNTYFDLQSLSFIGTVTALSVIEI